MGDRGISPVIGTTILIAIVTILIVTFGAIALGLVDEQDPAPTVAMELEHGEDVTYRLQLTNGDELDGDQLRLVGVANENALDGQSLQAGDHADVVPVAEEILVVWTSGDESYVIARLDVDLKPNPVDVENINTRCEDAENQIKTQGDYDLSGGSVICDIRDDTNTGVSDVNIDLDSDSTVVGDIDTDGDVDVDSSTVAGDITTDADDITITDQATVYGDVVAQPGTNIDIDGDSEISGAVVAYNGNLDLNDVTVEGHVYVDPGDFSCSGGTTIGPDQKSCAAYTPKNPSSY